MSEDSKAKLSLKFCQNDGLYTELVRKRAYELYVERGMEDGHAMEDWIRAEEEALSQDKKPIAVAA
jgi:hypothetical protein